jgi:uncharacterized integral membrane protein
VRRKNRTPSLFKRIAAISMDAEHIIICNRIITAVIIIVILTINTTDNRVSCVALVLRNEDLRNFKIP